MVSLSVEARARVTITVYVVAGQSGHGITGNRTLISSGESKRSSQSHEFPRLVLQVQQVD